MLLIVPEASKKVAPLHLASGASTIWRGGCRHDRQTRNIVTRAGVALVMPGHAASFAALKSYTHFPSTVTRVTPASQG